MNNSAQSLSSDDLILVLTASGKTGRRVAERLEAKGVPVRRGSRAGEFPFDWNDPTTWEPALTGVRALGRAPLLCCLGLAQQGLVG